MTSLVQEWFTLTNTQYGNIASRTNGAGCIHIQTHVRTIHTYIYTYVHIENPPANSPVWGSLMLAPISLSVCVCVCVCVCISCHMGKTFISAFLNFGTEVFNGSVRIWLNF